MLDEVVDDYQALRFRKVIARGTFLEEQTIYIDNQVYKSKVGYRLITPFSFYKSNEIESQRVVLVDRGWLPAGVSRTILPNVDTVEGILTINGRLNLPFQKPPIWDDKYPVFDGDVWQFLPIDKFSEQTGLDVLPLVLELAAPEKVTNDSSDVLVPIVDWATINNEWVQKHQAYALQWFSMSLVFFIACLVVLIKSLRVNPEL